MNSEDLIIWIRKEYDLEGEISVELLRSYTNDVYLVKTSNIKYILKIYSQKWRSEDEILWEVDLINYLDKKGVLVAGVINRKNGKKVGNLNYKNNIYYIVLFEYAKGNKPSPPYTFDIRYQLGKAAASIHKASDDFKSKHTRQVIDLKYLIDDSILIAYKLLNKDELIFYEEFGLSLKAKISTFIKKGLDWGPIHGDLTLDNIYLTDDDKIIFYDFDSSGFGFRAMELFGLGVLSPDKKIAMEAYLKGYQEIRPINQINIGAAPFLQASLDFWIREGMKATFDPKVLNQQLKIVRDWAKYFKHNLEI